MKIIRNRRIVEDDWLHLTDDAAIPAEGNVLVSLDRWRADRAALLSRSGKLGVVLPNTTDPTELADDLENFAVIGIDFPIYRDGRGLSIGRLVRDRLGFQGEIRAVGNVLRDQLLFMERCGFDAYELQEGKDLENALEGFADLSVSYQDAINPRSVPRNP